MNKKWIALAAVLGLLAAGGAYLTGTEKSAVLTLSGNVDIREVALSFRVAGRLQNLTVDEGATVHQGDVLGSVDAAPFRIAEAEAVSALAAVSARAALMQQGYRQEDVAQARANLAARESLLAGAVQTLNRQKTLAETGAGVARSLEEAQTAHDQAAAQVDVARQQLQALSKGFRKEEVAEAKANQDKAEAQLEKARLQLTDTLLLAPADGVILTRALEPGSMLAAGSPVLTLSLIRPVWVRAYVRETELGQAVPGKKVDVYTDSRAKPYHGVIGFVSGSAEFTPKSVETSDLRTALVYRLRIIIQDPDQQLRQGMPVTVKIAGAH